MKIPAKLRLPIFFIVISFINCLDKREIFAENIRKNIEALTKPARTNELVYDFKNKLTLLFYTSTIKELDEIQVKYDLSDSLMLQIKAARYVTTSGVKKVNESNPLNYYSHEESLGAAIKENDGRISFALIKTKSFARLKPKYQTYTTEECHHVWIFFKKCHDVEHQREIELTNEEITIINQAVKYSSINSISEAVDILKKGDYELYMSDTGSIFSPDHKSVAHVTYFGDLAIGPTSELNAILPVKYEYRFKKNGENDGHLVKQATGNIIELKDYPNEGNGTCNFISKKGYFHKFNFLVNKIYSHFPSKYLSLMRYSSGIGPYVLEVKKNGNVLLYQKNRPNNPLWTTNTANKGTGPYNLHLTNEKKLILEDSTGKILYESDDYKEMPTISYTGRGRYSNHAYNGFLGSQLGNKESPLTAASIHIEVDNKAFYINYKIRNKESKSVFSFRSNVYNSNLLKNAIYRQKLDSFNASFSSIINDDYDICYTIKSSHGNWASIACNGESVGILEKSDGYIVDFIIYIKEIKEDIPDIIVRKKETDPFAPPPPGLPKPNSSPQNPNHPHLPEDHRPPRPGNNNPPRPGNNNPPRPDVGRQNLPKNPPYTPPPPTLNIKQKIIKNYYFVE